MVTVRHREMEAARGGPIDQSITVEKVRQIVDEFPAESEFVDFKAKHTLLMNARRAGTLGNPNRNTVCRVVRAGAGERPRAGT